MENYHFSYQNIDACCEATEQFLKTAKVDRREGLRTKLMLEEMLLRYRDRFGEEAEYVFRCVKRFFAQRIEIIVAGEPYNPLTEEEETEIVQKLLAEMGLAPTWSYKNGKNYLVFCPKKKPLSQTKKIVVAAFFAIVTGLLVPFLPEGIASGMSTYVLTPVTDKFVGMLSAISGPMIFLSIVESICSMGDLETLGKIGKKTILVLLTAAFLTSIYSCLCIGVFTTMEAGGGSAADFSGVVEILYGIVPVNLFTPFTEGNVLQIIFIAVLFGSAMLVLVGRVPQIMSMLEQLSMVIQTIMEGVASLLYVLVYVLLLDMIVGGSIRSLLSSYTILLWVLALLVGFSIIVVLWVAVHQKVSPVLLVKKVMPTFLIGLTTASSAAAFGTNVRDAEGKLGIERRFVRFGIPLGQIIFKPGFIVMLTALEFGMAEFYDLPVTFSWIIIACVVNFLMSVAVPPIPGGAVACYTIVFTQLGIPMEAIAVAFAIDMITDFPNTGVGLGSLQLLLVEVADSLKMLDKDKLKKTL